MKLTRADVLAMQPGREMDACVAKQVMEWVWNHVGYSPGCRETVLVQDFIVAETLPQFSTDIAAAWLMEEEIAQRNLKEAYASYLWNLCLKEAPNKEGMSAARFFSYFHAPPDRRCRAALLTLCEE